jgi:hypothetical protein
MFRKGGRTHVVPLPPLALEVLKDLRAVTGKAPWVFVGKRGASLANNPGRFADFIRETAGLDFSSTTSGAPALPAALAWALPRAPSVASSATRPSPAPSP